jgi:hypothetical protein
MSKIVFEPAITCSCDSSVFFDKYRNWIETTETEFPRYRFLEGTHEYIFFEKPKFYENQNTKPKQTELSNA